MYTRIGHVELRSGELVEAGVVQAPDTEWAPRIGPMLQHKGTPWIWQIANLLTRELGIDVHFYVLHREGRPLANVMTVDRLGVGIFGHVWTQPDDRRQGASSQLVRLQLDHFRQRHGRALYLGTDYDSFAYHLYRSFGFEGIESRSDYMAYVPEGSKLFDTAWFAAGPVAVEALDWSHWPLLQPLALGRSPGLVRNAAMQIYGRQIFEGGPLPFIRRNAERQARGQTPVAAGSCQRRNPGCRWACVLGRPSTLAGDDSVRSLLPCRLLGTCADPCRFVGIAGCAPSCVRSRARSRPTSRLYRSRLPAVSGAAGLASDRRSENRPRRCSGIGPRTIWQKRLDIV